MIPMADVLPEMTEEQVAVSQIMIWLFLVAAAVVYFLVVFRFYIVRGDLAHEYEVVVDEHDSIESYITDWIPEAHK